MSHLTFAEAGVVGLIQGVTELFPLSSLGHNVLIPALAGGSWARDLNVSKPQSPYLAYIVGLHVATALAMIIYFWRDWLRITGGFLGSLRQFAAPAPGTRRFQPRTPDQALAWLIIIATIPVGIMGLALEKLFRTEFSKPVPTAVFLAVNGLVLLSAERLRRRRSGAGERQAAADLAAATTGQRSSGLRSSGLRSSGQHSSGQHSSGQRAARRRDADLAVRADQRLARLGPRAAFSLGLVQVLALLPGLSRDGVVMTGGMFRGLTRADAARFSFLLSAPVILAAGVLKVPDLMGPLGDGIRAQVLFGAVLSGIGAYLSLRFLVRYLSDATRTLTPFAIYCLAAGIGCAIYLSVR